MIFKAIKRVKKVTLQWYLQFLTTFIIIKL